MSWLMQWGLFETISAVESTPFITKTARQLLFDGYEDPLMSMADMFSSSDRPMDKFAWFYKRNGTTFGDGTFNSYTGDSNISLLNQAHTFNNQTSTHFNGNCGRVTGSADGFFPPFTLGKTLDDMPSSVELFTHQACRSMTYLRTDQKSYHHGLASLKYNLDTNTFANGTTHEPNVCFENNLPSGLQNNSYCRGENVPIYLSFPHFYTADPYYQDQFSNLSDLNPTKDQHGSFMNLDFVMSALTAFTFSLQLNIEVFQMPNGLAQVPPELKYFPALWFKSEVVLPEANAKRILSVIQLPSLVRTVAIYSIGPVIILTIAILCLILNQRYSCKSQKKNFLRVETMDTDEDLPQKDKNIIRQVKEDSSSKLLSETS